MVKSEKITHTFAMEVKISAKKKSENDIACIHQTNTKYSIQHTKAYMNKKMFKPPKQTRIYVPLLRIILLG
jgi:hypothetical protein